jgi:carboxymethylenebutenolidase
MRRIVLLLAVCIFALFAQDWAKQKLEKSTRHREWVTLKHDGRSVEAYIAYPEVAKKAPVVLVIHEIFGLSDWAQLVTDEFAAAGYVAIAPDLLSGKGPNGGGTRTMDQSAVMQAIRDLPQGQINGDFNAAADYALKQPAADAKLFVAGFCYGGGQSFLYATNRPDLKAAFVFYGTPPPDDSLSRIKAPIYGFYGGNDARVTMTVEPTKTKMAAAGKTYDPVIFEGAGHGFMRGGEDPTSTAATHAADVKARDESWARMKAALAKLSK